MTGYDDAALDRRAVAAKTWANGGRAADLPYVVDADPPKHPGDAFVFFINGAKVRAPHGAMALIERV